ncbi:sodium/glutamate symporter [Alteromonas naphthalenivorans]|uniref:Sodium/glutamate symporter n=1 Tax=Alteromonas naphthalenivorans TaxID=715451 RepID=F5Z705_ALTNA|nr:sodium/glutamate symporter [Alteromonas naphthalenivorans]AEF05668.1 sodium/glutamate symporter [Alteromonas naphthalenivorans]
MNQFYADNFLTFTIAILVFFIGVHTNRRIQFLRKYNIPEPVTGGLIAALVSYFIYITFHTEITYQLDTRDTLLVYFFTGIGLNAKLSDLIKGGKPLLIMLALTLSYIVIQNVVGITGATLVGAPPAVGVLAGSTSLIGGHGTTIAWAPEVAAMGISNALEIGVACATIGLILASLIGGPIAHTLINRFKLNADKDDTPVMGIPFDEEERGNIDHLNLMSVFLTLHITIIIGWFLNHAVTDLGLKLPLFVTCLLTGIVLSNTIPSIFPNIRWPAKTKALAVISDFSLSVFLTMSLMSMQLWTVASLAGPLMLILLMQTLAAVLFILFILFPLMGKNYQAAVLSSGFGGFALGATPTAIANMTAVTKSHGPAPLAFIILPLVAAFFVDVTNSFVIRFALSF